MWPTITMIVWLISSIPRSNHVTNRGSTTCNLPFKPFFFPYRDCGESLRKDQNCEIMLFLISAIVLCNQRSGGSIWI